MLQGGVIRAQIGVYRRRIGLFVIGSAVVLVLQPSLIQQTRIFGPIGGGIGQVQASAQKAAGRCRIAIAFCIRGRGKQFVRAKGPGDMGIGQSVGLLKDTRQFIGQHEFQLGRAGLGARFCARIRHHHIARKGADKLLCLTRLRLWEARTILGVEGKGGACRVGKARPLAGLDRCVENGLQIAARQVGIFCQHKSARRDQFLCRGRGDTGE